MDNFVSLEEVYKISQHSSMVLALEVETCNFGLQGWMVMWLDNV